MSYSDIKELYLKNSIWEIDSTNDDELLNISKLFIEELNVNPKNPSTYCGVCNVIISAKDKTKHSLCCDNVPISMFGLFNKRNSIGHVKEWFRTTNINNVNGIISGFKKFVYSGLNQSNQTNSKLAPQNDTMNNKLLDSVKIIKNCSVDNLNFKSKNKRMLEKNFIGPEPNFSVINEMEDTISIRNANSKTIEKLNRFNSMNFQQIQSIKKIIKHVEEKMEKYVKKISENSNKIEEIFKINQSNNNWLSEINAKLSDNKSLKEELTLSLNAHNENLFGKKRKQSKADETKETDTINVSDENNVVQIEENEICKKLKEKPIFKRKYKSKK